MSNPTKIESAESATELSGDVNAEASLTDAAATFGAAGNASAESAEILNLLGDQASGGSCCGGSCCA